jgi:alanine racemase
MKHRFRVWAEIDCDALRSNFRVLREELATGAGTDTPPKIMAVLKANAYGHGAVAVARELVREQVDAIGVGDSQEALELRNAGISIPILILGAVVPGELEDVLRADVAVNLHSLERMREIDRVARGLNRTATVHLMVDTGMGRLGASTAAAHEILAQIHACPNLKLAGVCTHFSSPGESSPAFTRQQIERFRRIVGEAQRRGFKDVLVHAASHAGFLRFPEARFSMVRPGLALYGLTGAAGHDVNAKLRRVLSLKTQIIFLKDVPEGTPVSYSRMWYSSGPTRIATLPIGYNDGFPVALTGKAEVLVRGVRCPVVGRVTMDYIMVDVGHVPNVSCGDLVTIIGRDGDSEIRIEELSGALGTVPYEISCRLGIRVRRVYVNGGSALTLSGRNARVDEEGVLGRAA